MKSKVWGKFQIATRNHPGTRGLGEVVWVPRKLPVFPLRHRVSALGWCPTGHSVSVPDSVRRIRFRWFPPSLR